MRRYFIRGLVLIALLAMAASGALGLWLQQTRVTAADLPPLRTGDLVLESGSSQTKAIAFASRSLYTHVGLVEIDAQGRPFVVEAARTVQSTPLAKWIERGTAGRITVKRVRNLSDEDARKALPAG